MDGVDTMVTDDTLDLGEDDAVPSRHCYSAGSSIRHRANSISCTHPDLRGRNCNYINAVDGRNGYINKPTDVDEKKPLAYRMMDDMIVGSAPDDGKTYDLAEFDDDGIGVCFPSVAAARAKSSRYR